MKRLNRRTPGRRLVALAPLALVAGCAAFPYLETSPTVPPTPASSPGAAAGLDAAVDDGINAVRRPREVLDLPRAARPAQTLRQPATDEQIDALVGEEMVDANLAPQTIPQFTATVFRVLNLPFTMTPDVAARTDIIAGGTGGPISKRVLLRLTQRALAQHGVPLYIEGGAVIVGGVDQTPGGAEIVHGRQPPAGAGRVVQFFNVQTIDINALQALIQDIYPNLGGARITPDQLTNSAIISGPARDVANVVRALREIDQPRFAGSQALRFSPVYWSANDFANALNQALSTEGFIVSQSPVTPRGVTILPFPSANQILVFTSDERALDRVSYWVEALDQPSALGDSATTFVYQVRNTDAQSLGQLAMGQAPQSAQAQPPVGVPGAPPDQAGAARPANGAPLQASTGMQSTNGQFLNGRLLTDPIGNRILFTGTARDYAQLKTLLDTLDIPAPQVVIEVMIAEVTLTDRTSLGAQLWGSQVRGDGLLQGGTEGIEIGGGGGFVTFIGPEIRARVNAEASNNKINILQRPRLVTRSGGTARFQVGSDVPIITSQRATDFQSGTGGTDILQSVQYRQTGVILEVTPVVYGDRVDVMISQEVSNAGDPPNGSIASPTILNRSLTTQIAIADGWTGVLGGLISNSYTKNNTGVPFLKDIPVIGSAFQNNTVSGERTEMLILITPYVVRADEDMSYFTERYSADMNAAFRTGRGWSYTLTPLTLSPRVRGLGFDLPSGQPASERPPLIPRRSRPDDPGPAALEPPAAPEDAAPPAPPPVPEPQG